MYRANPFIYLSLAAFEVVTLGDNFLDFPSLAALEVVAEIFDMRMLNAEIVNVILNVKTMLKVETLDMKMVHVRKLEVGPLGPEKDIRHVRMLENVVRQFVKRYCRYVTTREQFH